MLRAMELAPALLAEDALALPRGGRRALPDQAALAERGLALRPLKRTDFPFLRALHAELRAADVALAPGGAAGRAALLEQQFRLQHAHFLSAHPRGDFCLVLQAGTPIGRFYFERARPDWLALELGLTGATRGAGIGTALIGWLQAASASAGAARLLLHVVTSNRNAARLYERLGFTDIASDWPTHRRMAWHPG